ncbi:MAG: DNA starvation/stationary phase protection protein [Planctomycetes bacterium]|nr:DNA starvation/stationary phase protection protein [Planctomycetota bacterium]
MKPNIGLNENEMGKTIVVLNQLLANEYVLYTKTRNYHWNILGPQFNDLHKWFETQYTELNVIVDDVAERIRQLGGLTTASLTEFTKSSRVPDQHTTKLNAKSMIQNLHTDHETIIKSLRNDIRSLATHSSQDEGTIDFLTGLMEQHEKTAWMLKAYLEE